MASARMMKYRFKEGKKQAWLSWAQEMKDREPEVVETLKNEGVFSESCFVSEDGEFVFYYVEAENFEKAKKAALESTHPIDSEHKKMLRECLEPVSPQQNLFYFENRN